jgi:oxygen-independent coproporphyrinogen-3 oxidase
MSTRLDILPRMDMKPLLDKAGLFSRSAPRYTSYPTAPQFHPGVGPAQMADWLGRLSPDTGLSLYLHVPFCERLCWFCACRTQGVRGHAPVAAYVETLIREIALVAGHLPARGRVHRLHWGGGTPTILNPEEITRIAQALRDAFDLSDTEFSVEIDPTCIDPARMDALVHAGLSRASLGIQDFAPEVQSAIGREQSFETTRDVIAALRRHGIASINADLVYGLPAQTPGRLHRTLDLLLSLDPSRIALFGYAHVPWMSRRQRMIREDLLPGPHGRHDLFALAADRITAAGFDMLGIDHFARPGDPLAIAARRGRMRRNFQGYTDDDCPALIGLGASSISRLPQGYTQNEPTTAAWTAAVRKGRLPAHRGFALGLDDRLRARAIEMLMCDFRIDLPALRAAFGDFAAHLRPICQHVAQRYDGAVNLGPDSLTILPDARALTRLIAMEFDAYTGAAARHSQAI